jgi:hypothetical protein
MHDFNINLIIFCFAKFGKLFEKLFVTCVEIWAADLIVVAEELKVVTVSTHTRPSSHKLKKNVFIIIYNHFLLKFSKLKNQVSKLRFKI